jgi:hypothetical protein
MGRQARGGYAVLNGLQESGMDRDAARDLVVSKALPHRLWPR